MWQQQQAQNNNSDNPLISRRTDGGKNPNPLYTIHNTEGSLSCQQGIWPAVKLRKSKDRNINCFGSHRQKHISASALLPSKSDTYVPTRFICFSLFFSHAYARTNTPDCLHSSADRPMHCWRHPVSQQLRCQKRSVLIS